MKNSKLYILTVGLCTLIMTSCFEDEGNYKYDESIQDISVKITPNYSIRKKEGKMSVSINPEVKTVDGDKSYLEYLWEARTSPTLLESDTIGREESVTFEFDSNDKNFSYDYYLRLYVTDTRTGAVTMTPTHIEVIKPYSFSWLVLHEKDNHAEIGAIEYGSNSSIVTPDAFTQDAGKSLQGKPLRLCIGKQNAYWAEYMLSSVLYIFTDKVEESGPYNHTDHFKLLESWNKLVNPSQAAHIDFTNITSADNCNNTGLLLCSKGNVFHNGQYSPFFFEMNRSPLMTGECYIEEMGVGPHTAVAYDSKGHRFVHLNFQNYSMWMGFAPQGIQNAGPINAIANVNGSIADPSNISKEIENVKFVNGFHYDQKFPAPWQKYQCYAYGIGNNNKSYVYVIPYYNLSNAGNPVITQYYEFSTPNGITKDTPMTSGAKYNNILFYAAGNKIYKLDVSTGKPTMIYQHDDSSAQITDLRMAVEGYAWSDSKDEKGESTYGHPYCRLLGAAVNKPDGQGEVVVLQLNMAGKVDSDKKHPSVQVHKGFGKIKQIGFI